MESMDIIVPWSSTDEWKLVGQLIYSEDIEKLKEAFEVLRCWKARCSKLPAGTECTIIILEALLLESELKDVTTLYSQNILASCYAMALTRFLNLASSFEKEKTYFSLYRIARHLNLPEWIVNLRHQSSHGLELPSLVVLKAGLTLALNWLDNEYWKSGPTWRNLELPDLLVEKFSKRFSSLVVSYQDLMKIKLCVHERHAKEKSRLKSIMEPYVAPNDVDWLLYFGLEEETVDEMPGTMDECVAIIISKLRASLRAVEKKSLDVGLILQHFLCDSLFLPADDALNLYSCDLHSNVLPREMVIVWSTFLEEVINKEGLLATFIQKLIDFKSRQEMPQRWASIWVKYLAASLKQARDSLGQQKKKAPRGSLNKTDALKRGKAGRRVQDAFSFDVNFLPGKEELTAIVEDLIFNPRKSCLAYITELLGLYNEPFSDHRIAMIVKAIEIQLQTIDDMDLTEKADSNLNLAAMEEFCEHVISHVNRVGRPEVGTDRTDSLGGWENLPLGVCPNSTNHHTNTQLPTQNLVEDVLYLSE